MRLTNKAIKRGLVYTLSACISLVLSSPFILQFLVNSEPVKTRIALEIEKYSGIQFRPAAITISLTPFPTLCLDDVDLRVKDLLSLAIDRAEVSVDFLQLVKQKVSPRRIQIYRPRLIYTPKQPFQKAPSERFKLPVKDLGPRIKDLLLALLPDSPEPMEIIIEQARTDYFATMDARLKILPHKGGLNFNLRIKKIDFQPGLLPSFDVFTHKRIKELKAQSIEAELGLKASGLLSGNIRVTHPQAEMTDLPHAPLETQSLTLNLSLSKDRISARLTPSEITYPKARVDIEFDHRPDSGKTSLIFTGQKIDIGEAREVCLPLMGKLRVVDILFDILRAGHAKHVTVGFGSDSLEDLFDPDNLSLAGSAMSARVKIPKVPLMVEHVDGQAELKKGVLHIKAQKGEIQSAQITNGVLDIDLLNHHHEPFSGKFNLKADLGRLPATLAALLPSSRLASELALITGLEGQAEGLLELDMPIETGQLGVRVKAHHIRASGRYARVPLPVSVTDGEFTYDPHRITLTNFRGTIGKSPVNDINAEVSLSPSPVLFLTLGKSTISTREFMPWINTHPEIQDLLAPVKAVSGPLHLETLKIQGPMFSPRKWKVEGEGKATDMALGFQDTPPAIQKLSCTLKAGPVHLELKNITALVTDIAWLEGLVSSDILTSIKMPVFIHQGEVETSEKKTFVHAELEIPEGPDLTFNLTGPSWSKLKPELVTITDGSLTDTIILPYHAPDTPQISFEGHLNTRTLEKLLVQGSPLHTHLVSLTTGSPITIATDRKSQVHVDAGGINLDEFLSGQQGRDSKETRSGTRPLLAQKDLFFKADSLLYQDRTFRQVDARIFLMPGKTKILINRADLCGLVGHGSLELSDPKGQPRVRTQFDIRSDSQTDISQIFDCLLGAKRVIEGQYTLTGKLAGFDHPHRIAAHQNGEFLIEAKNGRIYKATLLSRVLSVLNILGETDIHQQGFAYKRLIIAAEIKDSVIQIKKAYIDAENMAIITSGWVDPLNDKLDLTFLVAPFKTIDTIIEYIPLVNTILRGRLISLPARASGKISDPDVTPLHPSAVGEGLITLFTDLLNAPVRLITGEKNNE